MAELDALLSFAHELADEADAVALRYFADAVSGDLSVDRKPDATLVTRADTEIEALLRDRIAARHPSHVVLGEEFGDGGAGEWRWVIDPIDGTHNFVRGIPVFGLLLALEREEELVLGAVSAPAMQQRWWAASGLGAFTRALARTRAIRVSGIGSLAEAQVVTSTQRGMADAGRGEALASITGRAWRDRGFGDFWGHLLVAQGSAEAMLEYGPKPWDLAAPAAILVEAGGRMTDFRGRASWSGPEVLSSNGLVHEELLALLSRRK